MVLGMPRHGTPHRLKCTPYSTKQGVLTKPILRLLHHTALASLFATFRLVIYRRHSLRPQS